MTLRMIHGNALVSPDTVKSDGLISIPEFIQRVGRPSGILLQAATEDKDILSAIGKRVLLRTAISFQYDEKMYFLVKINQILAIVEGNWTVKIVDPIERCQWCKSSGEGNMLLDNNGYCITCGKNKYGEHSDNKTIKVSDDEVEAFGGSAEYQLNKTLAKGMTISYQGQRNRTSTEAGKPVKYVPPKRPRMEATIKNECEGRIISAASLKKRSRY